MAIWCTSFSPSARISAPTNMAARKSTGMRFITEVTEAVRGIGRITNRCSCGSRSRTMPAGVSTRACGCDHPQEQGVDVIDCSSGGITDAAADSG